MLSDAGRNFMSRATAAFEHYNGSDALRFARNAIRAVEGAFETPRIRELSTLGELTSANPLMQRWIMANPTVRGLYHSQRVDGYSDSYTDMQPGHVGEDHYDYRRVMDGFMSTDESGHAKFTQYVENLVDGDRDLIFEESLDIQHGWSALEYFIALGKEDPTSSTGGSL